MTTLPTPGPGRPHHPGQFRQPPDAEKLERARLASAGGERPPTDDPSPILREVLLEIARQDGLHGPYSGESQRRRIRLALATLEDEYWEALYAWRSERHVEGWPGTREELIQVAAVAVRAIRDGIDS